MNELYSHWIKQIKVEEKEHDKFRKRSKKIQAIYLNKDKTKGRFNIFFSNIQTIHSAVLSRTPKPDVARRFLDPDPVSRNVADIMQRTLSYMSDSYDFRSVLDYAVDDELVCALGQVRLRYHPYFKTVRTRIPLDHEQIIDDNGLVQDEYRNEGELMESERVQMDEEGPHFYNEEEEKIYEEIICETVPWDQFHWQPSRTWNEVNWAGFDHYLTRMELEDQFKEKAESIPLNYGPDETKAQKDDEGTHAKVYEIFDKKRRKTYIMCEGMDDFIEVKEDNLKLKEFYPFPEPLMSTRSSGKLEPVPDYVFYQDLAEELEVTTKRIESLTRQLRHVGVYDGSFGALSQLENAQDGKLIALDDFRSRFPDGNGDVGKFIKYLPLNELVQVITELSRRREEIKQAIFELIGISDILRGVSKASETLGAQQIKRQFAGLRISLRQEKVERFVRDIFRLKSEIIAERFSIETLSAMSGKQVSPEEYDLIKSNVLMDYKIDVESNSTVAEDAAEEQKTRVELLTGISTFLQNLMPAIQLGADPNIIKEFILFGIRGFKGARQLEELIESTQFGGQLPAQPGVDQVGGEGLTNQIPPELANVIGLPGQ